MRLLEGSFFLALAGGVHLALLAMLPLPTPQPAPPERATPVALRPPDASLQDLVARWQSSPQTGPAPAAPAPLSADPAPRRPGAERRHQRAHRSEALARPDTSSPALPQGINATTPSPSVTVRAPSGLSAPAPSSGARLPQALSRPAARPARPTALALPSPDRPYRRDAALPAPDGIEDDTPRQPDPPAPSDTRDITAAPHGASPPDRQSPAAMTAPGPDHSPAATNRLPAPEGVRAAAPGAPAFTAGQDRAPSLQTTPDRSVARARPERPGQPADPVTAPQPDTVTLQRPDQTTVPGQFSAPGIGSAITSLPKTDPAPRRTALQRPAPPAARADALPEIDQAPATRPQRTRSLRGAPVALSRAFLTTMPDSVLPPLHSLRPRARPTDRSLSPYAPTASLRPRLRPEGLAPTPAARRPAPAATTAPVDPGAQDRWARDIIGAVQSALRLRRASSADRPILLRLTVSASGSLARAEIVRSSGNPALDAQALAQLREARFPAAPAGLDLRALTLQVQVRVR
ncbi:TonB family protein [Pseudoponticoccus marisrubri]|uniref:TonB C-terminal domain-containing protein n=1 Tax=Pseudoponticoccus marisrubri TaxID=1685382 RepID=A0A0W7WL43_9RHOB|nr:TonB family protein [Pseudoponticoccus marisrubri]KUF11236.1 hypothetical protein AVJ23_09315 [Pseudoponticoccus marisrubri]